MSPHLSELRKYVEEGDEDAFRTVVSHYIGLVYGTARRQLNGDAAMAADATQVVFTDLAKQAHKLYGGTMLGGWLHRHTCFVAGKIRRTEARRKAREQAALELRAMEAEGDAGWKEIASVLDEAVNELDNQDRAIIVLRYLEERSMRSVGLALGVSEDAAQKRIQHALEKLRLRLGKKGLTVSAAVLGGVLTNQAVTAVPEGLIGSVSGAALTCAAGGSFAISNLVNFAFFAKPAMSIAALAILCAGAVMLTRQFAFSSAKPGPGTVGSVSAQNQVSPDFDARASLRQAALPPPSLGELALNRLSVVTNAEDDEAIMSALYAFWMEFDLAPESEQASFRVAIPLLAELWEKKSERIKTTVLQTFQRLSPGTERMIDICLEALGSTNETWIETATACLSRAGTAAAKATPALIEQLQRNYRVNDGKSRGSGIARMSLDALANIGPQAVAAVPMLKGFLEDTNLLYRMFGSRAYWRITGDAQTVLPILTDALLKEKIYWAAQILEEMGPAARGAVEGLRESFRTGEPDTGLYVYKALIAIDPSNPPDIQKIRDLLESQSTNTRRGAAEVLWEHNHDLEEVLPTFIKVLPECEHFYGGETRILNFFGQMGPRASDALPAIREILEKPTGSALTRIIASNTWAQIAPGTPIPSIHTR